MNGNNNQPPAPSALSGLIRPEQVGKLPQLNQQQKAQYQGLVSKLWTAMNQIKNPQDPQYKQAQQRLITTSNQLMNGMKQYRAAQAQAQAAAAGKMQQATQAQSQAPQPNGMNPHQQQQSQGNNIQFSQLLPDIQQKVNEQHFFFPPTTVEGTKAADDWLKEAKARYGQALQRAHMARSKKMEFQRTYQHRESTGNPLTPAEREVFQSKIAQCNKAIGESQSFMEKFKEQQATFQKQQARIPQQRFATAPTPTNNTGTGSNMPEVAATTNVAANGQGAPNAHSITSAVNAARNAAALAAQAGSPTHGQSTGATATPTTVPNPLNAAQSPVHTGAMDHSRPSSAHPTSSAHPNNMHSHTASQHAHPLNAVNGIKTSGPQITKNLQVADLKPVQMPPSRPTLNGGAGVGLPGQLAQPALTSLPGYVLETSEDGRVLSKEKLRELASEVIGPNVDHQLTPEAEELFLQVADDFVDDLVSAACKLAKLRGAQSLEARDIQVVLERQYNIRIPGYSTDEVRTVRRPQPAAGWVHKMSAVQAAKLTGGGAAAAMIGAGGLSSKE